MSEATRKLLVNECLFAEIKHNHKPENMNPFEWLDYLDRTFVVYAEDKEGMTINLHQITSILWHPKDKSIVILDPNEVVFVVQDG